MNTNFHRVAVVGAGAMGQGIAQMCAQAGSKVWVHDVASGAAEKACQNEKKKETLSSEWYRGNFYGLDDD